MSFTLNFGIQKANFSIQHGDDLIFIGSCFSDEIALKAISSGLSVYSNPFGTVFHPTLLAKFIQESITKNSEERIIQRDDLYFSWDANSSVYDYKKNGLFAKLQTIRNDFVSKLTSSKVIFITFGTAWVYKNKLDGLLVANCHKFPNNQFVKELSEVDELYHEWFNTIKLLNSNFPDLKIVFTNSPVRHIRDGLVENNQSKAILIELVRRLTREFDVFYFPSYEIVIDELRDYRFFKLDRVHPSDEAIDYIWDRFESVYCSNETIQLNLKVKNFRKTLSHKSIHKDSRENIEFIKKTEFQLQEFLKRHPKVIFY